jgi:hypothetical protein
MVCLCVRLFAKEVEGFHTASPASTKIAPQSYKSVSLLVCLFVRIYFKKKLYILLVNASLLRFLMLKQLLE